MTLQPTGALGVYVHVPFCRRHCPYCDFAVVVQRAPDFDAYVDALSAEIAARAAESQGRRLQTVYFGGGTPSALPVSAVARILDAALEHFGQGNAPTEVTFEMNPEDAAPELLDRVRAVGVDRLSLGVQSFEPDTLAILGRAHTGDQAHAAVRAAQAAGFQRVSCDLIASVPGAPDSRLVSDLDRIESLADALDHVSVYDLTIEPGTAFARRRDRGELGEVPPARAEWATREIGARLGALGFERYEVSSFARRGRASVHNTAYWRGDEYIGVGIGAHSLAIRDGAAVRRWNTRSLRAYLAEPVATHDAETLSAREHLGELIMLGVRTTRGVDFGELESRFAPAAVEPLRGLARRWHSLGWGTYDRDVFLPSARGLDLADILGQEALANPSRF